jgi:hypothetical protein
MPQFANLRDAYLQPGFTPEARAYIEERTPDTFILPLHRHRKKTPVESADKTSLPITMASFAELATSIAAVEKSSSNSNSGASIVLGAA